RRNPALPFPPPRGDGWLCYLTFRKPGPLFRRRVPQRTPTVADQRLRAPDRRNLFTIGLPVSAAMTDVESRGLFIRGGFVPSSSGKSFPVYDPHTDEVYAKVAEAGTADVDAAVDAAREAFDGPWSALAP